MVSAKKEPSAKPAKKTTKTVTKTAKPRAKAVKTPNVQAVSAQTSGMSAAKLIKAWFNGWRQTFNLKGRSSRFEFWAFLLLNAIMMVVIQLKCTYIMSERYLLSAHAEGYSLDVISRNITFAETGFYLTVFIPLFPIVSLVVRRMHDLGKIAWANYFEPLFMSVVVMSLLLFALLELNNTDYAYTALCLSVCFITLVYGAGFYGLKILIMTMFYRGDAGANEFGMSQYNDDEHEGHALNLSCLYFLFVATIGLLYLTIALV